MGADRKLVRWDKAVEYYRLLEKESGGKLKVVDMGPTEMGNPFLLVIVTSPANQARLEELRQMNLKLSDPRGVPEAEIKRIVAEGKVVICQTMSMHASEVGGVNMAPELTYDLVSRTDEESQADPGQRRVPGDPVVQPGRRDHDSRLLREVPRHRVRGRRRCRGSTTSTSATTTTGTPSP